MFTYCPSYRPAFYVGMDSLTFWGMWRITSFPFGILCLTTLPAWGGPWGFAGNGGPIGLSCWGVVCIWTGGMGLPAGREGCIEGIWMVGSLVWAGTCRFCSNWLDCMGMNRTYWMRLDIFECPWGTWFGVPCVTCPIGIVCAGLTFWLPCRELKINQKWMEKKKQQSRQHWLLREAFLCVDYVMFFSHSRGNMLRTKKCHLK